MAGLAAEARLELKAPTSSWPGLTRPSTTFSFAKQDVDARHKAGHDEKKNKKAEKDGTIAPQRKLANEKPKGETVDYDALIKSWPATPPKRASN